ncbi:MAG: hypothetical protein IJ407_05655 [Clostridia bacterium]|nr:hypothetical protein [Clostridia bacterium]
MKRSFRFLCVCSLILTMFAGMTLAVTAATELTNLWENGKPIELFYFETVPSIVI